MKIKRVRATPVRVPVTRTGAFARDKRTHVRRTIVEIEAEGGLGGIGETRGEWSAPIIAERFAPLLAGVSAWEVETIRDRCLPRHMDYGFPEQGMERIAFAGVELALWDLAGKATGQPLFRLLGGPVRERAPFVAYAYTVDLDEGHRPEDAPGIMADLAAKGVAATGAAMFEFKVGKLPLRTEIEVVKAVRAAVGPDVAIAIDANLGYGMDEARRFLAGVAECRLDNFEEPVATLADTERLRHEFGVPVSTHCVNLDALRPYPGIDSVVSDLHLHGGIAGVSRLMAQVGALGRRFWLRSSWELGISWAAMCHLGVARPELDRPAQQLVDWIADDLIQGDPWLVRDGGVRPPERPGLGVELDRAAFERYRV